MKRPIITIVVVSFTTTVCLLLKTKNWLIMKSTRMCGKTDGCECGFKDYLQQSKTFWMDGWMDG